jgi:hypothetical protein
MKKNPVKRKKEVSDKWDVYLKKWDEMLLQMDQANKRMFKMLGKN